MKHVWLRFQEPLKGSDILLYMLKLGKKGLEIDKRISFVLRAAYKQTDHSLCNVIPTEGKCKHLGPGRIGAQLLKSTVILFSITTLPIH